MAMPTRPSYLNSPVMASTPAPAGTPRSAASRNVTAIIHNPERSAMLCRYPSKLCDMLRSEKRGGGLHRFCAYHRERANINQRRVDHRRRLRKKGLPVPPLERAPSHWQSDASPRHSDMHQSAVYSEDEFVKKEHEREEDDFMQAAQASDMFDDIEAIPPLLPDFSETDLQELLHLLDHVGVESTTFTIKEEQETQQNV